MAFWIKDDPTNNYLLPGMSDGGATQEFKIIGGTLYFHYRLFFTESIGTNFETLLKEIVKNSVSISEMVLK